MDGDGTRPGRLVVITGLSGSGQTTLATELATATDEELAAYDPPA